MVNALPRHALVIGNTRYEDMPLKNPGNDAAAIGAALKKFGFNVNIQLDAGRAQMAEAIRAFGGELARSKGVGLFYYAGHGVQLAWRNYLVPVDAAIERIEDVRERTVELNSLLQGMVSAGNPMNVIILDACRDNPFGRRVPPERPGLSQFDAPPGSLLAYATSPGNTAIDGSGENGLYTENLLRELGVPEAKIEDVFKRVRLAVRRRSGGQQIPWESTSLEEDFYFVPPKQFRRLSEVELEKLYEAELALWEKIKSARETEPLVDYLRRYPSGKFSELAQFRLDRLLADIEKKRIEAEKQAWDARQAQMAKQAEEERLRQSKLEEEKRRAEEERQHLARLAEEKRRAEEERLRQERLAEEKRLAEEERQRQVRLAEERRRIEAQRRAEEERLRQERLAEEKRFAEEMQRAREDKLRQARLEEERRRAEEQRRAEEERLRQARLAEEKRLAEEERQRQTRLAEEKRRAEAQRRAEEERLQQERQAAEKRHAEEQRLAEEHKRRQERPAAQQTAETRKPAVVAPAGANPFSKGTSRANVDYRIGDAYTFRIVDVLTQLEREPFTERVTGIDGIEVIYNGGRFTKDLLGNNMRTRNGTQVTDAQFFIAEYSLGKKWTTRYSFITPQGELRKVEIDFRVVAREPVTVPAGTFEAWKIDGRGFGMTTGSALEYQYWIAPEVVRRAVLFVRMERNRMGRFFNTDRMEMMSFRQA